MYTMRYVSTSQVNMKDRLTEQCKTFIDAMISIMSSLVNITYIGWVIPLDGLARVWGMTQ